MLRLCAGPLLLSGCGGPVGHLRSTNRTILELRKEGREHSANVHHFILRCRYLRVIVTPKTRIARIAINCLRWSATNCGMHSR